VLSMNGNASLLRYGIHIILTNGVWHGHMNTVHHEVMNTVHPELMNAAHMHTSNGVRSEDMSGVEHESQCELIEVWDSEYSHERRLECAHEYHSL